MGIMRKGCTLILKKCDLNTVNDGASAKASPFHAPIVLGISSMYSIKTV